MKKKLLTLLLCSITASALLTGCSQFQLPFSKTADTEAAAPQAVSAAVEEVTAEAPAEEIPAETAVSEPAPVYTEPLVAETVTPESAENLAENPGDAVGTFEAEPASALQDGQMYSYLTGEPVSVEVGMKRPFAVMINNLQPAIPQSGIAKADVMYEAMVEGSITRLMAVFQDISAVGQLGPVRSSRHYYLYMSDDQDAIYTHFGWSPFAQSIIENEGRQTINGQFYDGDGNFYRTSDREAPHNAYATGQGLLNIATDRGIPLTHSESWQSGMKFNTTDTPLADGEEALRVNIPFNYNNPYFAYNEAEKVYYRWEYDAPHIDMETNEQLSYKNIIVLYVAQQVISDYGHLELGLCGTMDGLYITDGKAIPIEGYRDDGPTYYYDMNGNEIRLNPGKTMIEYVPDDSRVTFGGEAPVFSNASDNAENQSAEAEEEAFTDTQFTEEPVFYDTEPVYYDTEPVYYDTEPVYDDGTDAGFDAGTGTVIDDGTGAVDGGEVYVEPVVETADAGGEVYVEPAAGE